MNAHQLTSMNEYYERKRKLMAITKPMLAATLKNVDQLDYTKGYLATQKLDGIRAIMINGELVSRTFKPIRNNYIRTMLEAEDDNKVPKNTDKAIISVDLADWKPEPRIRKTAEEKAMEALGALPPEVRKAVIASMQKK